MRRGWMLAVLGVVVAPCLASAAAPTAQSDALGWLGEVDRGAYAQSWSDAGEMFRSHVTQDKWAEQIGPTRAPLGTVLSRHMISETPATSLPGAPDGQYDVLKFATVFAHKSSAVETLVLAKEADGWKVDGYFIK